MVPNPSRARRRGSRGPRIAAVATIFAAVLVAIPASTAGADSPVTAVPDEAGVTIISGVTYGALAADVDGDGVRELVTIADSHANQAQLAVELWRQAVDGTWFSTGQAPLRRRASPDERLSAVPHPDAQGTFGVGIDDAARLIAWHDGSRTAVLVAVNSGTGFNNAPPCCLTVYRLATNPLSGAPVLRMVADTGRGARVVLAADLDGDGVDELTVAEPPAPDSPSLMRIAVLRWDGSRFVDAGAPHQPMILVSVDDPLNASVTIMGDSDGQPGVEVGVVGIAAAAGECPGNGWRLTRIALRSGSPIQESVCVSAEGTPLAVPAALGPGGSGILYGNEETPVSTIAWPAGSPGRVVSQSSFARRGRPLFVIGNASNPWVVLRRNASGTPVLELDRPDLTLTNARGVAASASAALFMDSPLTPYVGPWPATSGASAGFLFAGTLLGNGATGFPASKQVAMLAGAGPVGPVGVDGAEMALLRALGPGDLVGPSALDPSGGPLVQTPIPGVASIVPLALVTSPEVGGGVLAPPLIDAIDDPAASSGAGGILVGSRTFMVQATAPAGTLALTTANGAGQLVVLGEEIAGQPPGSSVGPPFRITVTAPSDSSGRFPADVFLVTPAGHGYRASFSVRVVTKPPSLSVAASLFSFGMDAQVTGTTDPGTRVVVDGTAVPVASDGTFGTSVSAGLTPRVVTVVAQDPLGHLSTKTIGVVAPVDYRRLPWIPIIVALTVVAAVILFVRAPRPGGHPPGASVDEGVFEDLNPD